MDNYLKEAFRQGKVQLFVGSGLSNDFYPNANEFKEKILNEPIWIRGKETNLIEFLNSEISINTSDISLEDAAQYFEIYQGIAPLISLIKKTFGEILHPSSKLHRHLWLLPNVKWIYTTNFDCLIEDALRYQQQPEVITSLNNNSSNIDQSKRVVFKIHGCVRKSVDRSDFIITRSDYLEYTHRKPLEELKTILDKSTRVFLFLGYSLKDNNMRHIIHEARKMASSIISYAVVKEPFSPEVEYWWYNMGVHLINMDAESFIEKLEKEFPIDESEWSIKIELRVEQKQEIARKAVNIIKRELGDRLNIILDAGTTCYYLAQELITEIINDKLTKDMIGRIKLITNSPPIIEVISKTMLREKPGKIFNLFSIGGELRYQTQAFTPHIEVAEKQIDYAKSEASFTRTLAFIGAAAINEKGLKTKTPFEMEVKKAFINAADEIYVLADHSKYGHYEPGHTFWEDKTIMKQKMVVITDRPEEFDMLKDHFKGIER